MNKGNLFTRNDFEWFFKQNYQSALLISLHITKKQTVSEDIVQDTFLWIWDNLKLIQQDKYPKALLFKIVKNKSLNYRRDNQKLQRLTSSYQQSVPDYDATTDEIINKIIRQINTLPPRCQTIFRMVIFKKKKYQEVALDLGLSKNTIKKQMVIAYKYLRTLNQ